MSLTVVVLAKNEAANIEACLDSAAGADEFLVIDDHSDDDTAELALAKGARVLRRKLDDFSSQLNYAAGEASGEWIFILDADERFTPGLMAAIRSHMAAGPVAAGRVVRDNFAFGRQHRFGPLKPDGITRLFPRTAVRWEGLVHPHSHCGLPEKVLGRLIHFTYKDWNHYFRKLDQYAALWAQNAHEQGRRVGPAGAWARLMWNQFKMFILNGGLLGGPVCWALCFLNGEYTLKKYLKLLDLNRTAPARPAPLSGEAQ
ncbi:MAG: glycosyltransferase family 2 protein [Candidatus Adiutrix sp.]|jgi:glycosyltransferase involved in cell wall biosynthesis|nr:glycosyltransferase family 2 protein [Candidatus Adiutrix sp.]